MKRHNVDVLREILLESIFLRGFDGCLARDDGADFGCYVYIPTFRLESKRGEMGRLTWAVLGDYTVDVLGLHGVHYEV